MQKTIALCIPAYNAATYLPTLVKAAHDQAIPFDEIIVYDDCSTDNTIEVAESLGVKLVKGPKNRGCNYARMKLAENATCDYVHFHDADDGLLPNFTSLAHKWLVKEVVPDVVLFDYEWRDFETKELLSTCKFHKQMLEEDALKFAILNQINPFCGLYNRSRFLEAGGPDLDPLVYYNEDVAMHCQLARYGLTFSAESEVSIINWRVKNSMSRVDSYYQKNVFSQFVVMRKNYELTGNKYNNEIAEKLWQYSRYAAWISDWQLVKDILNLLRKMGKMTPVNDSASFKAACKINPYLAIKTRELLGRRKRPKNTYWY